MRAHELGMNTATAARIAVLFPIVLAAIGCVDSPRSPSARDATSTLVTPRIDATHVAGATPQHAAAEPRSTRLRQ